MSADEGPHGHCLVLGRFPSCARFLPVAGNDVTDALEGPQKSPGLARTTGRSDIRQIRRPGRLGRGKAQRSHGPSSMPRRMVIRMISRRHMSSPDSLPSAMSLGCGPAESRPLQVTTPGSHGVGFRALTPDLRGFAWTIR